MVYESTFILTPLLPFRLDLTVWTLRRRGKNHIDNWDGKTYTRIFAVNNSAVKCQVTQIENMLEATLKSLIPFGKAQAVVADTLKNMLGLEFSMEDFYKLSSSDPHMQMLAKSFRGVKPPRFPSIFEALLNAVACQQVTLDLGILLLNRLAETFGQKFEDAQGVQYAFPRPEYLQDVPEEEIKKLGFSYQKARTIKEIASLMQSNESLFSDLENTTNEEVVILLSKMRGIGRWSSEYVLLRGLGRLDTFPGDDVGAQNNLQRIFHLKTKPGYEEIKILTSKWQPYAGLVYFHLLLEKLQVKGSI